MGKLPASCAARPQNFRLTVPFQKPKENPTRQQNHIQQPQKRTAQLTRFGRKTGNPCSRASGAGTPERVTPTRSTATDGSTTVEHSAKSVDGAKPLAKLDVGNERQVPRSLAAVKTTPQKEVSTKATETKRETKRTRGQGAKTGNQ